MLSFISFWDKHLFTKSRKSPEELLFPGFFFFEEKKAIHYSLPLICVSKVFVSHRLWNSHQLFHTLISSSWFSFRKLNCVKTFCFVNTLTTWLKILAVTCWSSCSCNTMWKCCGFLNFRSYTWVFFFLHHDNRKSVLLYCRGLCTSFKATHFTWCA